MRFYDNDRNSYGMYEKQFFEQIYLAQNLQHQKLHKVSKTFLLADIKSVPFR